MSTSSAINGDEIELEHPSVFRLYKNGRFDRLILNDKAPADLDPVTGVESKDITIDPINNVSARIYLPSIAGDQKLPVVVYFHGGGFFLGSSASVLIHHFLNTLSSNTPLIAVSIDYRLAPEHPLPAAFEDSWIALRWIFTNSDPWLIHHADMNRVFLAGDSAGANISHHMALRARDSPDSGVSIKGIALIHPYFYSSEPIKSEDLGFRAIVTKIWNLVYTGTAGLDDPMLNPISVDAPDLANLGCQRVMVAIAGKDELRHWGKAYYEKLKKSDWGGEVELVESPDVEHVFHIFDSDSDQAKEFVKLLAGFFSKM